MGLAAPSKEALPLTSGLGSCGRQHRELRALCLNGLCTPNKALLPCVVASASVFASTLSLCFPMSAG